MINAVLVEGPDCSGKSTLIDRIKNELKWDSRSLHHRQGDQFLRYLKEYSSSENVVFDRGHISEYVYDKMWRGGKSFSENELNILDKIVKERFFFILSSSPLEVLKQRYKSRKFNQQIKIEELETSKMLFDNYASKISFNYYVNYESKDLGEIDLVIKEIKRSLK